MGDFFHGWRRKVGLLTLVMACVFTAGWIRADGICDEIHIIHDGDAGVAFSDVAEFEHLNAGLLHHPVFVISESE